MVFNPFAWSDDFMLQETEKVFIFLQYKLKNRWICKKNVFF